MLRRRIRIAAILLFAASAVYLAAFLARSYLLPKPTLKGLLESGRYSIVVADDVEVRKGSPDFGALIKNLNTVVLKNPRILSSASPAAPGAPLPAAGYVVVSEGDYFAKQMELAIMSKQDDDATLKAEGITPHGEGIKYLVLPPCPDVDVYESTPRGALLLRDCVHVTHLLIK